MRLFKLLTFLFCIFHASTSISADLCKEYRFLVGATERETFHGNTLYWPLTHTENV